MNKINYEVGEVFCYNNRDVVITRFLDLKTILVEDIETGIPARAFISDLKPIQNNSLNKKRVNQNSLILSDKDFEKAKRRFETIKPILENRGDFDVVMEISNRENIHYSTLYRWVNNFEATGIITSLLGFPKTGGRGKSRLTRELDEIIKKAIQDVYLTTQKKPVAKTILEVEKLCRNAKLKSPHPNTVRKRILQISDETRMKFRYGSKKAKEHYAPQKGTVLGADYPLSFIQIDHTPLDIILVDEIYRKPVGRPWITLAMDVYSRMVLGFYISFDPPGAVGTGLCIANSILPKDTLLEKLGIQGDWPCWGIMKKIHLDNAREFHGKMLSMACEKYGIELAWRPIATPNWGGHIERLLGTFLNEVHSLPGTTFSNTKNRENYNSEEKASFTLLELEKWLTTFIVNIYHQRIHSSIQMSPIEKYNEGIFGNNDNIGIGLPPRLTDERTLRLDFMPFVERTVQEYGVVIDHIDYYHDILRPYINAVDLKSGKSKNKMKFIFRRDPRDLSTIYFYDPNQQEYYPIPYRNTSLPPISIWEYNEVIRKLKNMGEKNINEELIFETYRQLEEIELSAIKSTKKMKKITRSLLVNRELINENLKTSSKTDELEQNEIHHMDIKPYEDIDDEAFK